MAIIILILALILFVAGGWLYLRSAQQRRASGLPAGDIIYADTSAWRRNDRPLISRQHQLVGKPDYLVSTDEGVIPVEVKSTRLRGSNPYDSHKLQLAAYCLLVEDNEGARPPYGLLHYANATVRIPFDDALRNELLDTLEQMRQAQTANAITRSHDDPLRCTHCGFRHACGSQALA